MPEQRTRHGVDRRPGMAGGWLVPLVVAVSLQTWQRLVSPACAGLVADAARVDGGDVAAVERVRARHGAGADLMHAALELARARRKLDLKWPTRGSTMVADVAGAEMASSAATAHHKARRLVAAARRAGGGGRLVDLCCGIGADALGMISAGAAEVAVVDADPSRAWMAGVNGALAGGTVTRFVSDAAAGALPDGVFHLDPSRRRTSGGGRLWRLADHQPGPHTWRDIVARRRDGAIKLGPGVNAAELQRELPGAGFELEFISENGRLTQAVAWLGAAAEGREGGRAATLLGDGPTNAVTVRATAADLAASGAAAPVSPMGRYLIEADAAIERAGLLGVICARDGRIGVLHDGLGLLTGDAALFEGEPAGRAARAFTLFEVRARMPWIEKRVRAWLREHRAGVVEVKTRGRAVDPDALQNRLRGGGDEPYVVFVLRLGRAIEAIIARRTGADYRCP